MSEFVEECRREWKRLGVPDPVANEMAADLAADLEEAKADGASAEEVLGSSVFDPRAFAGAWAAERGLIQRPPTREYHFPRRSLLPAAIAAFALVAVIGAVLMIVASPSGHARLALASTIRSTLIGPQPRLDLAAPRLRIVTPLHEYVSPLPPAQSAQVFFTVERNDSVGFVLLIVGLAGIVALTLFWIGTGRSSRHRNIDSGRTGPTY